MESRSKNNSNMDEYLRLTRLASTQKMQLRTRRTVSYRVVIGSLAAAVVVAVVALGITLQMQSEPTIYAVCNGKVITDPEVAQRHAQESLSLLMQTLQETQSISFNHQ